MFSYFDAWFESGASSLLAARFRNRDPRCNGITQAAGNVIKWRLDVKWIVKDAKNKVADTFDDFF